MIKYKKPTIMIIVKSRYRKYFPIFLPLLAAPPTCKRSQFKKYAMMRRMIYAAWIVRVYGRELYLKMKRKS
jgi:hypothetical protein